MWSDDSSVVIPPSSAIPGGMVYFALLPGVPPTMVVRDCTSIRDFILIGEQLMWFCKLIWWYSSALGDNILRECYRLL